MSFIPDTDDEPDERRFDGSPLESFTYPAAHSDESSRPHTGALLNEPTPTVDGAHRNDGARIAAAPSAHDAPRAAGASTSRTPSPLTEGPIAGTLWRLAVPMAFGFVINAVYSWTNMYFVSRLGDSATAAIGFSDQINLVIFTIGSGFCIGTGIIVARRIGERRFKEASVIATQAFSFMALYASLAAVALWFVLPELLVLLNLQGEVLANTRAYLLTMLIGFPANLLVFQANSSIRSTGNAVFPMTVAIICAVTNALLDPLLIFGLWGMPKLGVQGAAVATVTAQWLGALICTYALYSGKLNFRLYPPTLRFNRDIIGGIFKLGMPSSLQTLAVSISRVAVISVANAFGTAAVAAYTIGLRVDVLVMMPIFATSIAIETLVSQNIGARRLDRVRQFYRTALRHLSGVIVAMGIAIYFLAEPIARTFTHDQQVAALTVQYLHIAVFGYLFFSIGQAATRSLSGAGHAFRSLLIVVLVLFALQLPLAFALSRIPALGVTGVFLAITGSFLVYALIGTRAVRGDAWMMKKV